MSRWEFMRQLEELLSDISPSEREEALQYYNDYFNDAGKENEQEVMQALGSPEQVAKTVKEGLSENASSGVFTETGFKDSTTSTQNEIIQRPLENSTDNQQDEHQQNGTNDLSQTEKKDGLPTWAIILMVVGCVFLSPVIFGLAVSAIAFIFSIIVGALSLVLGFGLAFIALYISAVLLVITGFGCLFGSPLAGIALIGSGCLCASLGILFMLLTFFIAGKCIPAIFQGIGYIFSKLFGKKGGAK